MKRVIAALVALALALPAFAQKKPASAPAPASDEKVLMQVEEDVAKAIVKGDVAKIEGILASEFMFVAPDGVVQGRATFLGDLRAGALKMESTKNDEMTVRVLGTTAVVVYRSTDKGTYKGQDISEIGRAHV